MTLTLDTILDDVTTAEQFDLDKWAIGCERDGSFALFVAERTEQGILFREPIGDELAALFRGRDASASMCGNRRFRPAQPATR